MYRYQQFHKVASTFRRGNGLQHVGYDMVGTNNTEIRKIEQKCTHVLYSNTLTLTTILTLHVQYRAQ